MKRLFLFRGLFQIRTGVDGFADRCLTARPRDLNKSVCKITTIFHITKIIDVFYLKRLGLCKV